MFFIVVVVADAIVVVFLGFFLAFLLQTVDPEAVAVLVAKEAVLRATYGTGKAACVTQLASRGDEALTVLFIYVCFLFFPPIF